jgi:hypothetical protein
MKSIKIVLAATFLAAVGLTASSVGSMGSAEAKAHVTPGKPGKCGMLKYYSKKEKGCLSKG